MGQVSLPRLEKINKSMFWESGLLYEKERWASPKLFLVHKLLTKYFFHKFFKKIKIVWLKKNNIRSIRGFSFYQSKTNKFKSRNYNRDTQYKNTLLGHYIYNSKNCYTTLIVYMPKKQSL